MFKNILNTNKSSLGLAEAKQQQAEVSSVDTRKSTTTTSSTVSAMRKGRKKLASMMSSLQRSSRKFKFNNSKKQKSKDKAVTGALGEENNKRAINHNNLPYQFEDEDVDADGQKYDDDDDDDDDAYQSAEETCYGEEAESGELEDEKDKETENDKCQQNKPAARRHINPIESGQKISSETKDIASDHKSPTLMTKKTSIMPKSDDKFVLPEEQCDIPTFLHTVNCDQHLISETRRLLKERYANNPDSFYDNDYKRMLADDWTVTRFLLRRRLDPKRTAKLMEECGRFRRQYKMSEIQLWEFPIEFHKAGGLFMYAPDRVGNTTMYMRVKMYRRVPEISDVFKAFILCVLEQCDVNNNGRGTAVIFDLSGCGLQNVDLGFLSWLLSSFRNYCPKGVSYILVYNLPWILNTTCKLAMTWMSASNRRALRFVHGDEIQNFIAPENLPDYCGGTCKQDYKQVPAGSRLATEVCDRLDMTREQALKIRELFKEYLDDDYDVISERTTLNQRQFDAKSHYDDAKSTTAETEQQVAALSASSANQRQQANAQQQQQQQQTTTTTARGPVVDLVSQASKFIAQ